MYDGVSDRWVKSLTAVDGVTQQYLSFLQDRRDSLWLDELPNAVRLPWAGWEGLSC